jgi:hypothetical protein
VNRYSPVERRLFVSLVVALLLTNVAIALWGQTGYLEWWMLVLSIVGIAIVTVLALRHAD